jgi:hypothetical protein
MRLPSNKALQLADFIRHILFAALLLFPGINLVIPIVLFFLPDAGCFVPENGRRVGS